MSLTLFTTPTPPQKRALRKEELGQALVEALALDRNGATYAVVPDLPLLDVPNGTRILMLANMVVAKLLARLNLAPTVLGPRTVFGFAFAAMLLLLYLVQFLLALVF